MKLELPDELLAEKIAAEICARVVTDEWIQRLVDRVADAICQRLELLDPAEAAGMLQVTTRTLQDNHVAWQLDKSVAFGATNPRFFLSQVLKRAREKMIKGQTPPARRVNGKGVVATH